MNVTNKTAPGTNGTGTIDNELFYTIFRNFRVVSWFAIGVLTLILNAVILRGLVLAKELPRPCRSLLFNIAFGDLLVGATLMSTSILLNDLKKVSQQRCVSVLGLQVMVAVVAVLQSTLFPVNAYMSQLTPFRYRRLMSIPMVIVSTIIVWSSALGITVLTFLGSFQNYQKCDLLQVCAPDGLRVISVYYLVCLLIMSGVYFKLYLLVRRHICRIVSQTLQENKSAVNGALQTKAFKTVSLLAACFFFMYTPLFIYYFIMSFYPERNLKETKHSILQLLVCSLLLCKSAVNPIIYEWKIPFIREITHSLLKRCCLPARQCLPTEKTQMKGFKHDRVIIDPILCIILNPLDTKVIHNV